MIFSSLGIILPCVAMGICYMSIFCYSYGVKLRLVDKIGKSKTKVEAFRLAKSLFASFFLYFLCWIPLSIVLLIDTEDQMSTAMHMYIFVLAHLNSAMNPIFYAVFNPKIKESYKRFLNFASFGFIYAGVTEGTTMLNITQPSHNNA